MKNKTGYAIKKTDDEILGALCTHSMETEQHPGFEESFPFPFSFDLLLHILYLYEIDF